MTLQVGDDIGPYHLNEQIGSGGMATVFKAHQSKLGRDVAIKVMHDAFANNPDFLARFEREARIVARLDHPNIVPVYDYDEYNGAPYLVMKFIEGLTLKRLMQRTVLSPAEILDILEPVSRALHYAHEQGILHRDIKPSNVLIDRRGTPYLTDFGLARIAQAGESTMSVDSMLGTPHYISPEQAQGNLQLDARTDVYSLGVVLYQLVTGHVPFSGDSSYAIVYNHINTPPPPPRQKKPDISPAVEHVLLKALSKNPDDRYSSPIAMLSAYRQAIGDHPVTAAPPPQQQQEKPKPRVEVHKSGDDLFGGEFKQEMEEAKRDLQEAGEDIRQAFNEFRAAFSSQAKRDDDYSDEPISEAELRRRVAKRVEKRQEELTGLIIHLVIYFLVNSLIGWNIWVAGFWGIGMFSHFMDYWNKHGPGRERHEQIIRREMERERERLYGSRPKIKNEQLIEYEEPPRVRLNDDGEFTESFVDEIDRRERHEKN